MNKNDLIAVVAGKAGLSKADAARVVDAVFDSITDSLRGGSEVRLVGFGTFMVTDRKQSKGRNPRTGEKITIPAARVPKFKAGKGLKEVLYGPHGGGGGRGGHGGHGGGGGRGRKTQ